MIDFKNWSDIDLADFQYMINKLALPGTVFSGSLNDFYVAVEEEETKRGEDEG